MTTLLLVHAHPDDESILTGGVMASAHLEGHRVVLITATRGEDGDPETSDAPPGQPVLADLRTEELHQSCAILGVDRQEFLDYIGTGPRESGRDGQARAFHLAPLSEVADRVAVLLREERPEVVVTYGVDGTYGHPDHRRAHAATMAALDVLAAEGWSPSKVYLHAIPRSLVTTVVEAARSSGIELPEALAGMEGTPDEEITTQVDVRGVLDRKLAACAAHRTQMHPGIPLAAIAGQVFETAFGVERFTLARGELVGEGPETSVFAGL